MDAELLSTLIGQMKEAQNSVALEKILIKMQPLVKKYTKKLYFMERDDAAQELNISLIESVHHIKKYDNEAMCLTYIKNTVINKYYYLCKQHIKFTQIKDEFAEIPYNIPYNEKFNNIELFVDIQNLMKDRNKNQKRIIKYLVFDELSDSEISSKMKLSRQYVNRIKKNILGNFFDFKYLR